MSRTSTWASLATVAVVSAGWLAPLPAIAAPVTTFVVTSAGDQTDAHQGDGVCSTSASTCTLRAALQEADATTGAVEIDFAIPGTGPFTLLPATKLPTLTNTTGITIDGYTEPGAKPNTAQYGSNAVLKIQIKGQGSTGFEGLEATAGANVFRGLSIYNFRHSIWLEGSNTAANQIVGDFICTDAAGVFKVTKVDASAGGVLIQDGSNHNTIGVSTSYNPSVAPPAVADRNVISGCAHRGVIISYTGSDFNHVQDNLVGLNPAGTAALPNQSHGIDINYVAQDNLVGGPNPGEGNVVSGNVQEGVEVSHGAFNRRNDVIGNFIGTGITGTTAPAYAANGMMGIRLEGEKTCDPCDPNAGYSLVADNVVVDNAQGILIDKGQQHNVVRDNLIGVLPDGTAAGNGDYGVRIEHGAVFNTIGPDNTIANSPVGVEIDATESQPPSSYVLATNSNTITQNSIFHNTGLGIDLAPYNIPNVNGTSDPNVAGGIQAPVLSTVTTSTISGTTCASCTIEMYAADVASVTPGFSLKNYGQGKTYLGSTTANSSGAFTGTVTGTPLAGGEVVTATATDSAGNTSEFAKDATAPGGVAAPTVAAPAIDASNQSAVPVGGTATPGDTITFAATDGTATTPTGSTVAAGDGTWSGTLDASNLADGQVTVAAVANEGSLFSPAAQATTTKKSLANAPNVTSTSATDNAVTLTWQAPSQTGGAAIDGYKVTLTPPTGAAKSVTKAAGARTHTFGGLKPGKTYAVSVAAHTAAGNGAASAPQSVTTKVDTVTTIATNHMLVAVGSPLRVSGKLTRLHPHKGLKHKAINLYRVSAQGHAKLIKQGIATAAKGKWKVKIKVKKEGRYQASYPGSHRYAFSRSRPTAVIMVYRRH